MKKKAIHTIALILIFFAVELAAHSVAFAATDNFATAIYNIKSLVQILTTIGYSLAFLAFIWGMVKFLGTQSEEKKKDALKMMVTSIAIIFIMTTVWGLVALIRNTLQLDDNTNKNVKMPVVVPLR